MMRTSKKGGSALRSSPSVSTPLSLVELLGGPVRLEKSPHNYSYQQSSVGSFNCPLSPFCPRPGCMSRVMSTNKSIVTTYCVLAAVFFAACAYAQLNDPDPALWVVGYVLGGCVFNALVVLYHGGKNGDGGGVRSVIRVLMYVFVLINTSAIVYIAVSLLPRIDLTLPGKELAWSVLEFEEGREIAGLVILLLHVLKLRGYLSEDIGGGGGGKGNNNTKGGGGYGYVATAAMVGAIIGAVYLWVYYQPEMNARYKTEHCDGAFGDNKEGAEQASEL